MLFAVCLFGCSDTESLSQQRDPFACEPERSLPYANGTSYLGVHADQGNSDFVPCEIAEEFKQDWHALKGFGLAQPNTFSLDGKVTYVTTSQPTPESCSVHALDVESGEELWCKVIAGAVASSVEVDADGHLFVTGIDGVYSLDSKGGIRWQMSPPDGTGAIGLHFTHSGHIATITNDGLIMLLDRSNGTLLTSLDVKKTFGLVPPKAVGAVDLSTLVPQPILEDFAKLNGTNGGFGLAAFAGADKFSDNTVCVAKNALYTVGGGLDEDHGAMVQVLIEGEQDHPTLRAGWRVDLEKSSASSPSLSPDGTHVKVLDGNSMLGVLSPESASAHARIINIEACNKNTDENKDAAICAPEWVIPLRTGPALGASPMLDDAVHYLWEVQLKTLTDYTGPDLIAMQGDKVLWELTLPDDMQWTSIVTVTEKHLLGTATKVTKSDQSLVGIPLPATASSELVVVEREKGKVVFRAPVTDDSTSTVTVGKDGSVYVTMLALVHSFAIETGVTGGIIRFTPQGGPN